MKNVIKIKADRNLAPELEVTDTGSNSICVLVTDSTPGACMEIFYGSEFREIIPLLESTAKEIPAEYCKDGGICRIRYHDTDVISNFIHIIGDESKYDNLILQKKSNTIFFCGGTASKPKDYMQLLANLIRTGVRKEAKACYAELLQAERIFNQQLERLNARTGKTVWESVESLKDVKNKSGALKQNIVIDHVIVKSLEVGSKEVILREVEEWQ